MSGDVRMEIENIKLEIIERLKPLNINQVILFGSYAYGVPHKDSDIDLYVVTNDDFLPQSFEENMNMKLKVLKVLDELTDKVAMDIIVHTRKMNEKFIELNSYFARTIYGKGQVLL